MNLQSSATGVFCAAPMMRYSHVAARRLWHFLCPPAQLYTEMLTAAAVIHGVKSRRLDFSPRCVLQLGGCAPDELATAAAIGEAAGALAINLNCGCPSVRVQRGQFGACLMKTPAVVAAAVAAMKKATSLSVTVKCRIAADDMDSERGLDDFVDAVIDGGADGLIVHARRALLCGLNPAQNRTAPPLDYARVRRLKERLPHVPIVLNGGIADIASARAHLSIFDGVMLGRVVVRNPYILVQAARDIFGLADGPDKKAAVAYMLEDAAVRPPCEWRLIAAAISGLFHGEPCAATYRRCLSLPFADAALRLREYLQDTPPHPYINANVETAVQLNNSGG